MKEPAANRLTDALRSARVRPDSWLVGAFLVLLGVAVSAALPQISGAVRTVVADAAKSGTAERAQRPTVRLHFIGVRAGTFDDPELAKPQMAIWTSSAPSWAAFETDIPHEPKQAPPPKPKGQARS